MTVSSNLGSGNDSQFEYIPIVLIADDDPAIRLLIKHVMEQCNYKVVEAIHGMEAVQHSIRYNPDLIIMDAVMPVMDGFRATEEIKRLENCIDTPVLMATSLDDDNSISRAFDVGACDYVTKPFNWSVLKHRINRMLLVADAERKMRHIAYHDALTGLPNRVLFMDRIDQAITRAQREDGYFALLYIDIDHFKIVNDSMGHAAGDELLNVISQRLRNVLRKSDTISRLGGDEFTVIVEDLHEVEMVTKVANNILEALENPVTIYEKKVHVGGSIGIALYPQDGETFGALLKNADTAMYKAKESGRQTFQFYAQEMSHKAMHRMEMENQLRRAIKENEFVVYYQPKVNLESGCCTGVEALLRWQHPEFGLIAPDEFIQLAEETGLITQLDEWVMKESCAKFKSWLASGLELDNLSVNVSAKHFRGGGLPEYCKNIIEESGIQPLNIEIELTESALVDNNEKAKSILLELKQLGVKIALDDFGTGYASMSYLKEFPFDTVKLDRSFVQGIPENNENTAIVKAMIQLAKALKLQMVAEGVETDQQMDYLQLNDCQYAQGYLWSKPVSADVLERKLLQGL